MKTKKEGVLILVLIVLLFSISYSAYSRIIAGDTIIGKVVDINGNGVGNETVVVTTSTLQRQCLLYGGCYCNAPKCSTNVTTLPDGKFNLDTKNLKFEEDFYCDDNASVVINITEGDTCAAPGDNYLDDLEEYVHAFINDSGPLLWNDIWDNSSTRYEYRELVALDVLTCNETCIKPQINGTISDQSGTVNSSWNYDLTPYLDNTTSRTWKIKGVNPLLINISVAGNTATFNPKTNKYGYDKFILELINTDNNLTDSQEVVVYINKTIEFKEGWNLWSLPIVENNSVEHVLDPLGNGIYGCGRTTPYTCSPGDFNGSWELIWAQNPIGGEWVRFWPKKQYTKINQEPLQYIDPTHGYWIDITEDINLTIDYR